MSGVDDVIHTDADLTETLPKLSVRIDEEKARLAGLNHSAIARQLDASLEGAVGGSLVESTEELPIRVRLAGSERGDLSRISSLDLLPISNAADEPNQFIPISALGSVERVPERAVITRRNGRRVNVVRGYITAGVLPGEVLAAFLPSLETAEDVLSPLDVPDCSDGKIAHLVGLNLSRAWMMEGIASGLADEDGRQSRLLELAVKHRNAGLSAIASDNYALSHWIGSFAVYLTTERGVR